MEALLLVSDALLHFQRAPQYSQRYIHFYYDYRSRAKCLNLFDFGLHMTGKSTHNQRIERLWRDVFQGCLCLFYDLFYHLENCNVLDPNNAIHLWCLHFVYIPIINTHLSNWKNAWARHPLRTEGNHSPLHLWIAGLHMNAWSNQDNHEMAAGVSVWKETPFFCMNFICSHQKCSHEISSNGVFPLNHKRTCISLPFTFQKKKLFYKYKQ